MRCWSLWGLNVSLQQGWRYKRTIYRSWSSCCSRRSISWHSSFLLWNCQIRIISKTPSPRLKVVQTHHEPVVPAWWPHKFALLYSHTLHVLDNRNHNTCPSIPALAFPSFRQQTLKMFTMDIMARVTTTNICIPLARLTDTETRLICSSRIAWFTIDLFSWDLYALEYRQLQKEAGLPNWVLSYIAYRPGASNFQVPPFRVLVFYLLLFEFRSSTCSKYAFKYDKWKSIFLYNFISIPFCLGQSHTSDSTPPYR